MAKKLSKKFDIKSLKSKFSNKANIKNKNIRYILIVLIIASVLYLTKSLFIATIVNGIPISRYFVVKSLEKQGGKETLDSLVTQELIKQESRKQNISVTESEIENEITGIRAQLEKQSLTLETALSYQGQTIEDLRKNLKTQLTLEKLLEDKVNVSDTEITAYFEQNIKQWPEGTKIDDVREEINQTLRNQKLSQEYQKFITELKNKAKIINFVNYQ